MRRAAFGLALLASSLLAPWPFTLALSALGAFLWPGYIEGALAFLLVEGAALPDREGAAWLPLAAAALSIAGAAEIARALLARGRQSTV